MNNYYPVPDEQGLHEVKALYRERFGKELTDEEAYRVLSALMRFLYLINNQD